MAPPVASEQQSRRCVIARCRKIQRQGEHGRAGIDSISAVSTIGTASAIRAAGHRDAQLDAALQQVVRLKNASEEQLLENIGAVGWKLTPEQVAKMQFEVMREIKRRLAAIEANKAGAAVSAGRAAPCKPRSGTPSSRRGGCS